LAYFFQNLEGAEDTAIKSVEHFLFHEQELKISNEIISIGGQFNLGSFTQEPTKP